MSTVNQNGVGGGALGPEPGGGEGATGGGPQDRKWQGKKHSKHEVSKFLCEDLS